MATEMNNKVHHQADCDSCYSEPPEPFTGATNVQATSLYFRDGERSIDFVLAWKKSDDLIEEDLRQTKRTIYEQNLMNEGLELEHDTFETVHFTKIHATIEVLRRYSEILKLRMPMREVSWRFFFYRTHFLLNSLLTAQFYNLFVVPLSGSRTKSL